MQSPEANEGGEWKSAQINMFSTDFNQAIAEGAKEFIIIHGVGEGILKKAVHEFLKNNKLVKSISEADNSKCNIV